MKRNWIAIAVLLASMNWATAGPISTLNWQYEYTLVSGPGGFIWNVPASSPSISTFYNTESGWQTAYPSNSFTFSPNSELGFVDTTTTGNAQSPTFRPTGQGSFELSMTIRDPSGATGTLNFAGTLNLAFFGQPNNPYTGMVYAFATGSASFNQQNGAYQQVAIGNNLYTVSVLFGWPPNSPPSNAEQAFPSNGPQTWDATAGEFYAYVTQTPASSAAVTPEPATWALAGLGVGCIALRRARKLGSSFLLLKAIAN
jgi:hypothetical protein